MCGRFLATAGPEELARYFDARAPEMQLPARYNIAPTNVVYAVIEPRPGDRRIESFRWGLVPSWATDTRIAASLVNARSETVVDKPSFRDSFRKRRCIVPMAGFYEWHGSVTDPRSGRPKKQPYRISSTNEPILSAAGLWSAWRDPKTDGAPWLHTCTIITTAANRAMAPYHDRMPAFLGAEERIRWLSTEEPIDSLQRLLHPAPEELLEVRPVSTDVNDVLNPGPFDDL